MSVFIWECCQVTQKKLQALESQTPMAKETSHRNRHKSYAQLISEKIPKKSEQ